jgi:hypothetical protein
LDSPLHSFSQQAPPPGDGGGRDKPVPDALGARRTSRRFHAESGPERDSVPLQGGIRRAPQGRGYSHASRGAGLATTRPASRKVSAAEKRQ